MRRALAVLATLVLAGAALPVLAQQPEGPRIVSIVNADSVRGEVLNGERVRRLFGNVHLRQDETDLRARQAIQYLDRDLIVFEGDVRISDATDTLMARRISYDSRRRIGRAEGGVRLADAEAVLYSDAVVFYRAERRAVFPVPVRLIEREGGAVVTSRRGTYFTEQKEAFFEDEVRLEDETTVLTSAFGRYGTQDKRAEFTGNVVLLHDRSTYVRADTLTHFRETRVSEARGNVVVRRLGDPDADEAAPPDTTRRTLLFGGFVHHDEERRYSRVERGAQEHLPMVARLTTDAEGSTDTLLVRAHRFEVTQPESLDTGVAPAGADLHRIFGHGSVEIASQRLAAVADSIVIDRIEYEGHDGRVVEDDIRLYSLPMAWLTSRGSELHTQVSGEALRVRARGEAVDSLWALGQAFVARPDSALKRVNQLRGRTLLALFRDDSLRAIRVWPNAESIFFRADSLGQLHGAIRLSSDSLSFSFAGDELRRISGHRDIEGTYYNSENVPQNLALEGPPYEPHRRPTIAALLAGRPPLADPFADQAPRPLIVEPEAGTWTDLPREQDPMGLPRGQIDPEPPETRPHDEEPHGS